MKQFSNQLCTCISAVPCIWQPYLLIFAFHCRWWWDGWWWWPRKLYCFDEDNCILPEARKWCHTWARVPNLLWGIKNHENQCKLTKISFSKRGLRSFCQRSLIFFQRISDNFQIWKKMAWVNELVIMNFLRSIIPPVLTYGWCSNMHTEGHFRTKLSRCFLPEWNWQLDYWLFPENLHIFIYDMIWSL